MLVPPVAFLVVRRVLAVVGLGRGPEVKDVEIAVRHQLMVLQRQIARPCACRQQSRRSALQPHGGTPHARHHGH
jgi:hypothetical protein